MRYIGTFLVPFGATEDKQNSPDNIPEHTYQLGKVKNMQNCKLFSTSGTPDNYLGIYFP